MIRASTYEVVIEIGGKPEIEGIYQEEKEALQRAEYLLKLAKYTGVKVAKVSGRGDSKVIFDKLCNTGGGGATVSDVDDAFVCMSLSDVYCFESRLTLLRLMRNYFDQQLLIPLELLHNYTSLRYLERDALLFNQCGHKLAAVQARRLKIRADDRHHVLLKLFRELLETAKTPDSLKPYAELLGVRGLSGLIREVTETEPAADHNRIISYAVVQYISEFRDWNRKLAAACSLFEPDQSEEAENWLDEVLAEIIDGNEAVRAAIGYSPDLISALMSLRAVIDGAWDDRLPGTDALQKLSDVMAHKELPRVRAALLNRIATAVDGKAPLTKLDRAASAEAFKRLLTRLQEFGGFMGGQQMSAAVTRRAKIVLGRGDEDLSIENTVGILVAFLPTPAARIGYLLDLMSTDLGRKKAALLAGQIAELFNSIRTIYDFAPDVGDSMTQDAVRDDFRRRLYGAGIPRRLADGLMRRLEQLSSSSSIRPPAQLAGPSPWTGPPQAHAAKNHHAHGLHARGHHPHGQPPPAGSAAPHSRSGTAETKVTPPSPALGTLLLIHRGSRIVVTPDDTPFVIGRSSSCQLSVEWGTASRSHAEIRVVGDDFVLTDHSKNGTFLVGADHQEQALANSSGVLHGQGTITIGRIGDEAEAAEHAVIQFQRVASGSM